MSNTLLNYPWLVSWYSARRRCTDSKHHNARNYCNKGIKFYLTKAEIKALWFRDKAYNMSRPSIDRKNSDGHYEYNNCRFLELSKNRAEARRRKIVQTSLDGKLIKKMGFNEAGRTRTFFN